MKKIRINNDFTFAWAIERNGLPEDLSGVLNMTLRLRNSLGAIQTITDYTVAGNVVSVDVTPAMAKTLGKYVFILTYELPDAGLTDLERMCEVDTDAFVIVPRTAEADDSADMLVTSDMAIGFKGDKGDPFLYEDFTPEQLEALKVKGDPFLYSDFTPAQIAELQRPATSAAGTLTETVNNKMSDVDTAEGLRVTAENTRQSNETARVNAEYNRSVDEDTRLSNEETRWQNEQARVTAEGLRVTAEQTRQTNTATAIQNANTATGLANNAATLANTKAGLADTKAGLADTAANNANAKATLANDAATLANTKAGLADTAATNANNVANTYATTLAGKAEKGGSTKTLKQVEDMTSNLLYEYTHSGNIEVQVQSIDYGTNTFTKTAHGLADGDRLGLRVFGTVNDANPIPLIFPFSTNMPATGWVVGYFVVNATADTFQISTTSGGTPITLINRASVNLILWRFEKLTATNITLAPFPSNGVNVEIVGDIMQAFTYVFFGSDYHYWCYADTDTGIVPITDKASAYLLKGYYSISIRRDADRMVQLRKWYGFNLNQADNTKLTVKKGENYVVSANAYEPLSVKISNTFLTNGTKIRFYKL